MDFFENNYFDVIALPSTFPCVQPSGYNLDEYAIQGLTADNDWTEMGECESPCYTELTTYTPTYESTSTELDQFLMFDYEDSISVTTFDNLPDQTLMCTDSCEKFLKESSEILRVNSLKFQQKDELIVGEIKSDEVEEKVFFNCNFGDCKKTYSKPAHLRAHLRRHLGLKPYFSRHQRSHSGIKPYKCFYCSKTFSRSDHLKKHVKIHEKKMKDGKLKFIWDEIPKQKPGRKKKVLTAS